MKSFKRIFIVFTLVTTFFASTSDAQQDDKALVQECLQAQAQEFQPLVKQRDAVYRKFSNRAASIRNILHWLEDDYETADQKRTNEIIALETRLAVLKENAKLTSEKALKDIPATVETGKVILEDISDEQDIAIKPFSRKLTALQRKYKPHETALESVMTGLFREKLKAKATNTLSKTYSLFSYSSGTSSATYRREGETTSAAICYIYLVNDKIGKEKYGLFKDKYPVSYRSRNQLEVLVGSARVTIYSSDKVVVDGGLDATLASLVDIEKLALFLQP